MNLYFVFLGFFVALVFVWKCQQVSLGKDVDGRVEGSLILTIAVTSVETEVTMPMTAIVSARGVVAAGKLVMVKGDVVKYLLV